MVETVIAATLQNLKKHCTLVGLQRLLLVVSAEERSVGLAVQRAVLDRLGQMHLFDLLAAGQIGDGAGDLEDARM